MDVNKELERLQKEFDDFLYVVTHDIKAAVRNVGSLSSWIVEDVQEGNLEEVEENAMLLDKTIQQMNQTLQDLHAYSKLTLGDDHISGEDLNQFILDILNGGEEISVKVVGKSDLIFDKDLLYKVLKELRKNSILFNSNEVVEIKILLNERGIEYQDNSIGIPSDQVDKDLARIMTSHSHKEKTSGVGLCVVNKAALLMGFDLIHKSSDTGVNWLIQK